MILLQMHLLCLNGSRTMRSPVFNDDIVVKPYTISILTRETDEVVAGLRGRKHTGPTYRIVFGQLFRNTGESPAEIDRLIDSSHSGLAVEICIGKVFGFEPMLLA